MSSMTQALTTDNLTIGADPAPSSPITITPAQLSAGVARLAATIPGHTDAARFSRQALAQLAEWIPTLGATDWASFLANETEMFESHTICPRCGG